MYRRMAENQKVFGIDVEEVPEGSVLEVLVIAKTLGDEGQVVMHHSASKTLSTWEALGMVRWTQITLEDGLFEDDED